MSFPPQTATKVATSSIVVAAVVAVAGLGLLGMAAGLLPGITKSGTADLSVSASAAVESVSAVGDLLTYTVTVKNVGTATAAASSMTDRIANGTLTFVSASSTAGTCTMASSTITCPMGSIAAGKTSVATIKTKLAVNTLACGQSGTIMSSVTADSASEVTELEEAKNNAATTSTVLAGPCVAVLPNLTVTNLTVASSNGLVTATLKNTGTADATGSVGIYLYVDGVKSMTYSSATLKDIAWMTHGNSSSLSTKTIDATTVKSVKLCVDALEAVAESDETDNCQELSLGSSSASAAGTTAGTDLTVKKSGSVSSVKNGDSVSYTILVSNVGTVDAASVGLTDVYTDPFTYASATGDKGFTCTSATKTVVCKGGLIGAGKTATITVKLTTGSTGLVCDTTKVVTDIATVDPLNKIVETNEDNNKATADTTLTNPCGGSSTTTTTNPDGSTTVKTTNPDGSSTTVTTYPNGTTTITTTKPDGSSTTTTTTPTVTTTTPTGTGTSGGTVGSGSTASGTSNVYVPNK